MVAFGLLLSLVFGAVVCGGLGSIARQKNIQVLSEDGWTVHPVSPLIAFECVAVLPPSVMVFF